ncbi:hypothetical protein BD626DRAFT_573993 [Schizophyllum amplum]|uniref:C2H2-type domain-containing protein n=1 Tax=Schizophyllum amplum TaxID=97359 RepID=A0A550BZN1_9AGAR|nr:hypothetical protein BD626DRAFT_573993 [Auriculariopsis ampla]
MFNVPYGTGTGAPSVDDRIKYLRSVYNLTDTYTVPTIVGNHIICRFSSACNWASKLHDQQRAKKDFDEHIPMHVKETIRQKEFHYTAASTPGVAPLAHNTTRMPKFTGTTVLHCCSWHDCHQAFHIPEHLVEHVMQEHMRIFVGAYCPLCTTQIALETDGKPSAQARLAVSLNNSSAYTDPSAYNVSRTHDYDPRSTGRQDFFATGFVKQDDGVTYTAILPRGAHVDIASVTKGHPLQVMLQSILLSHYEGGKCNALESRVRVGPLEKAARIEECRRLRRG